MFVDNTRLHDLIQNDIFQWFRDCKRILRRCNLIDKYSSYENICGAFLYGAMYGIIYGKVVDTYSIEPIICPSLHIQPRDICALLNCELNYYKRILRLKKRISKLLTYESPIFVTLTFNNDVLASTSDKTRRRYVHYFLKSQGCEFVANIDYGYKNQREHYHAICSNRIDPLKWNCGACNVKAIYNTNALQLSKYINKLTNHSIKVPSRIIYSKDSNKSVDFVSNKLYNEVAFN